jgi:hypothetical protein
VCIANRDEIRASTNWREQACWGKFSGREVHTWIRRFDGEELCIDGVLRLIRFLIAEGGGICASGEDVGPSRM